MIEGKPLSTITPVSAYRGLTGGGGYVLRRAVFTSCSLPVGDESILWLVAPLMRCRRGLIIVAVLVLLALAGVVWPPLWVFLCPGALLLFLQPWRPTYCSELLVLVSGTSLGFWVVSFWWLKYAQVALLTWAYLVIGFSVVLIGVLAWRQRNRIAVAFDGQEILVLLLLGAAMTLRLSLYWREPFAPAGADMSMHGYITALIVHYNGVPPSHHPLLPIDGFGGYAAGFHTLTALISLLGGMPVYRSALLMETITFGLLSAAMYLFLRAFWDRQVSVIVALIVTFLPRDPQNYVGWGGIPTILALVFVVIGLALLWRVCERTSASCWWVCSIFLVASFLTHAIPAIGVLYALIPVATYWGVKMVRGTPDAIKPIIRHLLGTALISAILLVPYLPDLIATEVSAMEIQWVQDWQRVRSGGAWGGTLADAIITVPSYLRQKIYGAPFLFLSAVGFLALAISRSPLLIPSVAFAVTVVGLVINSMYWVLPLSYALYPERVALLVLLPAGLGIGALIDGLRYLLGRFLRWEFSTWVMAGLVIVLSVRQNEQAYYNIARQYALVTGADLRALRWLQANTKPDDVIQASYGDAGLWIPAIAFRAITTPHLNPFYFDELGEGIRKLKAQYVYLGARRVYGEPIDPAQFDAHPERYRRVYAHDGVTIYKIVAQSAQVSVNLADIQAQVLEPSREALSVAISTDKPHYRRHDVLQLRLDLWDVSEPYRVDCYLVVTGPDGRWSFYDGWGLSFAHDSATWRPMAQSVGISQEGLRNYPLLSLPLHGLPSGRYTWYIWLTEPESRIILAKATATFTLASD